MHKLKEKSLRNEKLTLPSWQGRWAGGGGGQQQLEGILIDADYNGSILIGLPVSQSSWECFLVSDLNPHWVNPHGTQPFLFLLLFTCHQLVTGFQATSLNDSLG